MNNIEVNFEAHLGNIMISLSDINNFKIGTVIDLNKTASSLSNFLINNKVCGVTEVLVLEKNLALRILDIKEK